MAIIPIWLATEHHKECEPYVDFKNAKLQQTKDVYGQLLRCCELVRPSGGQVSEVYEIVGELEYLQKFYGETDPSA